MSAESEKSVITFATNRRNYLKLALNCARSVIMHNDVPFYIISNLDFPIPKDLKEKVFIISPKQEHLKLGIGMKLYIDQYLQTKHSLFIDSDCLCFDSLDRVFNAARGMSLSVAGNIVPAEDWCTKEQANIIKEQFGISDLIRFNGGLYYIDNCQTTQSIFEKARIISEKYDEYGFFRIKDKWMNEEVPLSIAMTLFKQLPIPDDGTYMTDMYTDHRPQIMNVLSGQRLLKNPSPLNRKHRPWYPQSYSPVILHFGGSSLNSYPYLSQTTLLRLNSWGCPVWLSSILVDLMVHPVFRFYYFLKMIKQNVGAKSH